MSNTKYDDTDYLINREESIEYKISDTNVASIEKDIRRCEQLIKPEHANWIGISNQMAIASALARIKELEEEKKKYIVQLTDKEYRNLVDTIRKEAKQEFEQKVKDKIEENNIIMINMQNRHPDIYVLSDEWRNAKAQNKVLEEILEDK